MNLFTTFLLAGIATIGFGIIVNIPRKALLVSGVIGGISRVIYDGIVYYHLGLALSSVVSATVIGLLSFRAAKKFKMPMIIFNIPGIVPIVPGGQSYRMVKNFALNHLQIAFQYMMQVIEVTGAISIGFLIVEFLNRSAYKIKNN